MLSYGLTSKEMIEFATSLRVKDIRTNKIPFMPSSTDALENIIMSIV